MEVVTGMEYELQIAAGLKARGDTETGLWAGISSQLILNNSDK